MLSKLVCDSPIPPNLTFQKVDLTEPFPFPNESFDIVHARLVMMHVRPYLRCILAFNRIETRFPMAPKSYVALVTSSSLVDGWLLKIPMMTICVTVETLWDQP